MSSARMYLNGQKEWEDTSMIGSTFNDLIKVKFGRGDGVNFKGLVAMGEVYGRALEEQEVLLHYQESPEWIKPIC